MHLARDYAYQIVQNPREPHLFLGASSYRVKDKSNFKDLDSSVIDFNHSLSKQQIVPDNFELQIANDGWDIKGGPIFWQANKKDSKDERYLSEVFMLGSLKLVSNLIPNWTLHMVQTMEIERNPLCDFQLYAEGDITINTNINPALNTNLNPLSSKTLEIKNPVQINGNTRFSISNGESDNSVIFHNKFNCAGHALSINGTAIEDYILPQKYHMHDNHENYQKTEGGGTNSYLFNSYAVNNDSSSTTSPTSYSNSYSDNQYNNKYDSYERCMFDIYHGNFNTRSRVYRPIGFDPSNYWGFWEPNLTPTVGDTVDPDEQVLNYCFGFHNLAQSSSYASHGLYSPSAPENCNAKKAISQLRNLNDYQMTEKARLVEMQKPINFPALMLRILTDPTHKNSDSLYVPNNFIFSTYIHNAFPAFKDNIYLNRYLGLAFQNSSVIKTVDFKFNTIINNPVYSFDNKESPHNSIEVNNMYIGICNNKSAFYEINAEQPFGVPPISSIATLKSTFNPSGTYAYNDDNCPPNRLSDCGDHWKLDNYVTRITGEHYNFMYDRNRAKWIQLVDIDVGKLTTALNGNGTWKGSSIMPILIVNTYWQGLDALNTNKNYLYGNDNNKKDIRYNYSENRANFFTNTNYQNGSYVYSSSNSPVIDIGIRLINATTLPDKGLTFYCPYPIYIKGDFNTNNPKPALIVTDSITLLPNDWQDWRSQMDPVNSYLWYDASTSQYMNHPKFDGPTIYADIITGRTHPHFYIKSADITGINSPIKQTKFPNPDLGIHDAFRALCDFKTPIQLYGSLMLPYFCQEQWEPPINFCKTVTNNRDPGIHSYPPLNMYPRANKGIPAAMPFYYRINRGRKTQSIGKSMYNALAGETLYQEDWFSKSFSDYHDALPNLLRYETKPN